MFNLKNLKIPTPKLPIALPENAILTFTLSVGEKTRAPITNNPKRTEQVSVIIKACLQVTTQGVPNLAEVPGVNPSAVYLRGFVLGDGTIPEQIQPQSRARAEVKNLGTLRSQVGDFILMPSVAAYVQAVTTVAGEPIEGFFQIMGGGRK